MPGRLPERLPERPADWVVAGRAREGEGVETPPPPPPRPAPRLDAAATDLAALPGLQERWWMMRRSGKKVRPHTSHLDMASELYVSYAAWFRASSWAAVISLAFTGACSSRRRGAGVVHRPAALHQAVTHATCVQGCCSGCRQLRRLGELLPLPRGQQLLLLDELRLALGNVDLRGAQAVEVPGSVSWSIARGQCPRQATPAPRERLHAHRCSPCRTLCHKCSLHRKMSRARRRVAEGAPALRTSHRPRHLGG